MTGWVALEVTWSHKRGRCRRRMLTIEIVARHLDSYRGFPVRLGHWPVVLGPLILRTEFEHSGANRDKQGWKL